MFICPERPTQNCQPTCMELGVLQGMPCKTTQITSTVAHLGDARIGARERQPRIEVHAVVIEGEVCNLSLHVLCPRMLQPLLLAQQKHEHGYSLLICQLRSVDCCRREEEMVLSHLGVLNAQPGFEGGHAPQPIVVQLVPAAHEGVQRACFMHLSQPAHAQSSA